MTLSFRDCEINLERRELWHAKRAVNVEPQVFDLLVYLVQNRDRAVSELDLIASVWGGRIVSESTLTSRINAARTAVGDNGREQQLIRTILRKGLRFFGAVNAPADDNQQALAADLPSDGIHEPSRPVLPPPDRPAIAVLPFTNMSGDPEQEYFLDGIKSSVSAMWSRTACARAVTACGSQHSSTMSHPAATSGGSATTATLLTSSRFRTRSPNPSSPRSNLSSTPRKIFAGNAAGHVVPRALLEKAIAIDPNYGQALGVLATSHTFSTHMGWADMATVHAIAERAALSAVLADSEDPWAHHGLAYVYLFARRFNDSLPSSNWRCG
jgi:DNA-binding winged helix-turn-helix (wHTH) protein